MVSANRYGRPRRSTSCGLDFRSQTMFCPKCTLSMSAYADIESVHFGQNIVWLRKSKPQDVDLLGRPYRFAETKG